ncbi:hypothetical protein HU200_061381 [Digitaria exilis]|uniref:Uncharacterized protein n=1 Tax=Digitaria exilis TaxID=1010633 RepID=A0A835A8L9_9POAL|nr:hypothetical protein HU200_061381 [Digitaria exilis]
MVLTRRSTVINPLFSPPAVHLHHRYQSQLPCASQDSSMLPSNPKNLPSNTRLLFFSSSAAPSQKSKAGGAPYKSEPRSPLSLPTSTARTHGAADSPSGLLPPPNPTNPAPSRPQLGSCGRPAMEEPPAAAARQEQGPPGFFTFLKHGAVLPARNGALFAPLLVLTAALAAALLLGNALAVQPLAAAVLLDADAIGRADPATAAYRRLVAALQSDLRGLLLAVGGCLLGALVAGSAIKIATVFAAVAAFPYPSSFSSGGRATVAAAIGAAKGNIWGPVLTVAFGYAIELACAAAIVGLAVLAVALLDYSLLLLFLDALLVLLASLFLVYLNVVCAVAVVVSAAEPGRRGAGAVSRAWRLMSGRAAQAVLYVVATCALGVAVSPVYTLALSWWPRNAASGVAAGVAYVLLLGAVEVFSTVAVTAYYFQCRESKEEFEEIMAGLRYTKLPNGDEANM